MDTNKKDLLMGIIMTILYFLLFSIFIILFLVTSTGYPSWFIHYNYIMFKISLILAISLLIRSNNVRLLSIFVLFVQLFWGIGFWVFGINQIILESINSLVVPFQIELLGSIVWVLFFLWIGTTIRITIIKFLLKPETKEWFCLEEKILRWIKR